MSSDNRFLALRFEGPLQSWGFDSQYNRRHTGLMPTKSAVAGMCCAGLGYPRGSDKEHNFLSMFGSVRMTAIAIPRNGAKNGLPVRRLQDYHTIQNTKTADGKNKDCHITYRQYLMDAAFGILLEGDAAHLCLIATALSNPKWGIWLGRKACIPSAPVFAGLKENRDDALRLLIGMKPLELFTRQEEVENFADGRDSLPDTPLNRSTSKSGGEHGHQQVCPCKCPSINGIFRPRPAFSFFAILDVALLRLRPQNRCGLGLNRNLPFLHRHLRATAWSAR